MTQVLAGLLLLGALVVVLSPAHGPDLWDSCRRRAGADILWLGLACQRLSYRLLRLGMRVRGINA